MLYPFGKMITYLLVRILFRVRYEGLENIPADTGFILACNHRSNFDPMFIAHKVPKVVRYMAKAELFRGFSGWIFRGLATFPVSRGSGDSAPLDTAVKIIKSGGVMGMFPEGTRSRDGKPLRPRSGVAHIAAQTGADVLPCAVCYGDKLRFRTVVTVKYGKLIPFEQLHVSVDNRSSIRAASKTIMAGILSLLDGEAA